MREQALSCNEIATRLGKSRPTVLKMLQDAVNDQLLDSRKQGSIVFYSVKKPTVADVSTVQSRSNDARAMVRTTQD